MWLATPIFMKPVELVCGPVVGALHSGFEHLWATRFARAYLSAGENSSRAMCVVALQGGRKVSLLCIVP